MSRRIFAEINERLNHNLEVYERNVRNGFVPMNYPTSSLVMGNGTRSIQYTLQHGELRRLI